MSARIRRWLRALRPGWNEASSSTAPTRALGRSSSSYGTPPNVAEPDDGRIRPSSARIVVLLPAPFGPRNPVTRPAYAEGEVLDGSNAAEVLGQVVKLDRSTHRGTP